NLIWQKLYPEINNTTDSYKGNGLSVDPDGGYVIVGEDIQQSKSKLLILAVGEDGTQISKKTMKSTFPAQGISVMPSPTAGNFYVLGSLPEAGASNNIVLTECKPKTATLHFDSLWYQIYGAGTLNGLMNRIYTYQSNVFFASNVKKDSNPVQVQFTKTPPNSKVTIGDFSLGEPGTEENGDDLVPFGFDFLLVGQSKANATADFLVMLKNISSSGIEISSKTYTIPSQEGSANGNGVCISRDGGTVILATSKLSGTSGRGETDYCLIRVDGDGTQLWTKTYGSKYEDVGVSIITTSDGGHVILGTTNLANTKSILVMKTDSNGNIE
ncbi:MAG: hypothetical protein ACK5WF_18735, partial [Cyclobacteriaceae bacterium]